jgi:hypothetical protein
LWFGVRALAGTGVPVATTEKELAGGTLASPLGGMHVEGVAPSPPPPPPPSVPPEADGKGRFVVV